MKNTKRFLWLFVVLNSVFFPSLLFGQVDFTELIKKLVQQDENGKAISYFGKFTIYVCNGKNEPHTFAFIVPEKETHGKHIKIVRWVQFFTDSFVGKKGGGLDEIINPLSVFDIGSRSVYEVLPYDDKVVFVLIDVRAYDVLTFVCDVT